MWRRWGAAAASGRGGDCVYPAYPLPFSHPDSPLPGPPPHFCVLSVLATVPVGAMCSLGLVLCICSLVYVLSSLGPCPACSFHLSLCLSASLWVLPPLPLPRLPPC